MTSTTFKASTNRIYYLFFLKRDEILSSCFKFVLLGADFLSGFPREQGVPGNATSDSMICGVADGHPSPGIFISLDIESRLETGL